MGNYQNFFNYLFHKRKLLTAILTLNRKYLPPIMVNSLCLSHFIKLFHSVNFPSSTVSSSSSLCMTLPINSLAIVLKSLQEFLPFLLLGLKHLALWIILLYRGSLCRRYVTADWKNFLIPRSSDFLRNEFTNFSAFLLVSPITNSSSGSWLLIELCYIP